MALTVPGKPDDMASPPPTVNRVLHYISGPSAEGPDAYAAPLPRRGVVDELVWESLCYSTPTGYRPLFLDLHVPRPLPRETQQRPPLVVYVHGGGWETGSRRRFPVAFEQHWFLERILLAGFAVALVDYRLSAEAAFPAPVDDVRSALAWLADHADDFGYDARRVVFWGESAGAHLALLAAAAGGTSRVAAVVDWYGPTDLAALLHSKRSTEEQGGEPALSPGAEQVMAAGGWGVDSASPVRVLDAGAPPVFVAHGRDDAMVPLAQSELLRDHLDRLGVPVEYHETDGGHVFEGSDVLPWVIARSLDFLGRTLDFDLGPHRDPEETGDGVESLGRGRELLEALAGSRAVLTGEGAAGGRAVAQALRCRDDGTPVDAVLVNHPTGLPDSEDLHGLCPVLIGVGAHDPALEATLRFVYRLKQAGVPTRFRIFPTLDAGYWTTPSSPAAFRAVEQMARGLGRLVWDGTLE